MMTKRIYAGIAGITPASGLAVGLTVSQADAPAG
jgi:hypothetical protein